MATSNTKICNQALDKLGASRIVNLDDDTETSLSAIKCRLHFEQTRDALVRSHWWRFASARVTLSQSTVTPDFQWDFQYLLPNDFMRMKSIYENRNTGINFRSYELEGDILLTNETTMEIKYIKKVTDPSKFDSLFIEVLVLKLALKLVSLAGANPKMAETIGRELASVMPQVRALDAQETNTAGRLESSTWNDARYGGREGFPMRF